jgi:hypothetical protein
MGQISSENALELSPSTISRVHCTMKSTKVPTAKNTPRFAILLNFDSGLAAQKIKYLGKLFPAQTLKGITGKTFLEFFQVDKNTGKQKGIVAIDLGRARL